MAANRFDAVFREARTRTGLTLREFCRQHGFDWGNVSKLERGLLPPPQKHEILERYAHALNLREGSDEWFEFFDAAALAAGRLPDRIREDKDLLDRLPALFRTIKPLTPEKIDELIRMVLDA